MYIDLIVLIGLIIFSIFHYKKLQSPVFMIAIIDILLRILSFIKSNIPLKDISNVIDKYLPNNIITIIDKYTKDFGVVNDILKWIFILIMIIFLSYLIKIFYKKKRI